MKNACLFRQNLFLNSLKPQHSNPNINPLANQLWCIDLLLPQISSSLTDYLLSLNLFCYSKTNAWFMHDGRKANWIISSVSVASFQVWNRILLHILLLKCQIAFLKITSSKNQALLGCIPIPAEVVHLKLKS